MAHKLAKHNITLFSFTTGALPSNGMVHKLAKHDITLFSFTTEALPTNGMAHKINLLHIPYFYLCFVRTVKK